MAAPNFERRELFFEIAVTVTNRSDATYFMVQQTKNGEAQHLLAAHTHLLTPDDVRYLEVLPGNLAQDQLV